MLVAQLQHMLSTPADKTPRSRMIFWFCLSLTFAAVYGLAIIHKGFSDEYVVQDDARQHVFWMARFIDPELFSGDLIADYFQSVAPGGYTTLYRLAAIVGIDPIVFSKLVPLPILLVTTAYCFGVCLQILPVPIAGFLTTLLLNQSLLVADDVNSGTPRAFIYPFFLGFLYYLLKVSPLPCLLMIGLLGLFYPQMMLVACGMMIVRLIQWQDGRLQLSHDRRDYLFSGAALLVGAGVMLLYVLEGASEFGPAIKAADAMTMPEFWGTGRASFFSKDAFDFWVVLPRSGILPRTSKILKPHLMLLGLLLPVLIRWPHPFPLVREVTNKVWVFIHLLLPSIGLFFLAHLLLFTLHHPSRYVQHSYRIGMALAGGIALTILLDALCRWAIAKTIPYRRVVALTVAIVIGTFMLLFPVSDPLGRAIPSLKWLFAGNLIPGFVTGGKEELYEFFAEQPKDSVIASVAQEANNLPTFSRRSVLVAREYAIPYHVGYYNEFKERVSALIQAQYSPNPRDVRRFIEKYDVDFWLLDKRAFELNYVSPKFWIWQYQPTAQAARDSLKQGTVPFIAQMAEPCTAFKQDGLTVLKATCLVEKAKQQEGLGK
ncbi:hypothetical protein [Pantanalinema sp. GBBB05]|uniref:hypothetical protein n=1 Tax=Pantanalinema sp. GBBB05 TaxID=2604139 RepID=UPI001DBE8934|nr:hypothetical protein [Pantanalinema sp. GBBB05]